MLPHPFTYSHGYCVYPLQQGHQGTTRGLALIRLAIIMLSSSSVGCRRGCWLVGWLMGGWMVVCLVVTATTILKDPKGTHTH